MVFPELCHGCGGCRLFCPTVAISDIEYEIGCVEKGSAGSIEFVQGRLTVGRALSPPIIRAVKRQVDDQRLTVIDCPPGTSCPFVAGVKDADAVILVTEPTPFGLHDLTLAVETVRQLNIPFGVIINRVHELDNNIAAYCKAQGITVLMHIPEHRSVAVAYSQGDSILATAPELKHDFQQVLVKMNRMTIGGQA